MFYALALGSMLAYALQHALLARHAREMDGLSLGFYRNISFVVTLLPLLLWSSVSSILEVLAMWPQLLLAALSGGASLGFTFTATRLLPVGIAQTGIRTTLTIMSAVLGWLFFEEAITPKTAMLVALVLAASIALAFQKSHVTNLGKRTIAGTACALGAGTSIAISTIALTKITRATDALASGYFWETSIALAVLALIGARYALTGHGLKRISIKTFCTITLFAWPTLVGTGFLALALDRGSVGIVTAIGSGTLIIVAILSWWMYGERLKIGQWICILTATAGIAALRLVA
jgi:drug/metabolite transporter (DMT)-like permease